MVLLLRYCGRLSSRYFILMKYKLKMLQFIDPGGVVDLDPTPPPYI